MTPRRFSDPIRPSGGQTHLCWLDWVRFIAAFMVVGIHARGENWVEWGRLTETSQTKLAALFFALTRAGTEWVLVFFVLSGFLVGGKLIERLRDGTFSLPEYVLDRVSRIWVPLVPALVWSAIVAFWVGKPVSWLDLIGNIIGLQGVSVANFAANHPLWSLGYEIWFYVLAGSLAWWLTSETKVRISAGMVLALVFAVFARMRSEFLFAWLLGALTYWLCHKPRMPRLAFAGALFMAGGYVFSQATSATVSVDLSKWLRYVPSVEVGIVTLSLGIALILPFLTQLAPQSLLSQRINDFGSKVAAFSYTLYLTHIPILYLWECYQPERNSAINLESVIWYLLRIASCLLFAWLFYLPFEKQTGRVRKLLRGIWLARTA